MFDEKFDFNSLDFDDIATEEFEDDDLGSEDNEEFDMSDDDFSFDSDDDEFIDDDDNEEPIFESAMDESEELSVAAEAAIFMDVVRESFEGNDDEFIEFVQENAVEWELYGLIPSASRALEAIKTLKIDNWKIKNRQRLIRRECIRIACKKGDANYTKYKKFRDLMRQYRQKIFDRYESKAKSNVLKSMNNSKAKASNIKSSAGSDLKKRVDNSKITSERGKDPTKAPKKSKAS